MFLHLLTDKQKYLFLELAIKAAEANGIVEIEEKNMIKVYSIEMGIKPIYKTDRSTDSIINALDNSCDERTKRIILFEILGIMLSDLEYDYCEKNFVDNLTDSFSIPCEQKDMMLDLLKDYSDIYKRISDYLLQ